MEKHIKKKFLNEQDLPKEFSEKIAKQNSKISQEDIKKMKAPEGYTTYLMTDSSVFQAFPYRYQGQIRLIPEPDPILVYFNSAYASYKDIGEKKKAILKPLLEPVMGEPMINEWYDYFALSSGFVTFLFTTVEAFINRCIPRDYEYKRVDDKKTEIFNKHQIEEYLSFNEKIKIVLPQAMKKSFYLDHPPTAQHITNLKEFRDAIIHTKTGKDGDTYDHLFKKALDFKYEQTINAVASFCNYYYPKGDYIVSCPCNNNW